MAVIINGGTFNGSYSVNIYSPNSGQNCPVLLISGGTFYGNASASKEGSKCNKNQRYQEYKIGAKRIVRLRIKRGILHCEFLMINRDLRNYVSENKIPIKESATVIKVQNTSTVEMVFSSIDLAIQPIEEERAYKKQLAKERRRQAKQQAKQ